MSHPKHEIENIFHNLKIQFQEYQIYFINQIADAFYIGYQITTDKKRITISIAK